MSSDLDREHINQLIAEKRYAEAKAALRQSNDPTAPAWLERLEQQFPETTVSKPQSTFGYGSYGLDSIPRPGTTSAYYGPSAYERGGCLTAWLIFLGVVNVVAIFVFNGLFLQIISSIFVIVCIFGIWNKQKWGYFGLLAVYALNILGGLFLARNIAVSLGGVIGAIITYALVNPQLDYFD